MKEEKEEMLDGAESQNYGYGYGTKVGEFVQLCPNLSKLHYYVMSKLINTSTVEIRKCQLALADQCVVQNNVIFMLSPVGCC